MTNSELLLIGDEAVMGIEPRPRCFLSGIFTQVARVAIKQFEKLDKNIDHHHHHQINHTSEALIERDDFVQEHQKILENEDRRAGTKLIIDEEEFMARAYNRLGRDRVTRRLVTPDHSPSKDNFMEEQNLLKNTREKFEERLHRERTLKRPITYDDDESAGTKTQQKKRKKKAPKRPAHSLVPENYHIPNLPAELENTINSLNGTRVKFLIQKELTKTDTNPNHNRLSIMQSQFRDHGFLREEEKKLLNTRIGTRPAEMRVIFIHPSGEEGVITFKKWDLNSSPQYVFIKEWGRICERYELIPGVVVRVWTFRTPDGALGFALAKV